MRIVGAVVLAVVLFCAWQYVVNAFLRPALRETPEIVFSVGWVGAAALIGLAARVAAKWRWAVGVPLLLVFAAAGYFTYSLASEIGGGPTLRDLLAAFVIGPAIIAIPVAAPDGRRMPVPSSSAEPHSRRLHYRELWIWLGVVGVLAIVLVSYGGPTAIRRWQLERMRRAAIAAVEDLVRTDVLADWGPVAWHHGEYGYWPDSPDFYAQGLMSDPKVALYFRSPQFGREFGRAGRAEGLRVNGLFISVPQPRLLSIGEALSPQVANPLLLSMGLRPELVSRLSPSRSPHLAATYRGVTYLLRFNSSGGDAYILHVPRPLEWCPTGKCVVIECRGVRSAASP